MLGVSHALVSARNFENGFCKFLASFFNFSRGYRHCGKQPYDKVHKTLLAPLLSGKDGYWSTFDWQRALTKGMASFDLPFSGQFDYVETSYVFPTTHMVAPKENVVGCIECHTKGDGRLANLAGF